LTILKNIEEAENKYKEVENNLIFAKKNLQNSKNKYDEILKQGASMSNKTFELIIINSENEIKRLKSLNIAYILFEQGKSIGEVIKNK
jgi:F0F1-type ATP synthase membrane subunit b/b'